MALTARLCFDIGSSRNHIDSILLGGISENESHHPPASSSPNLLSHWAKAIIGVLFFLVSVRTK